MPPPRLHSHEGRGHPTSEAVACSKRRARLPPRRRPSSRAATRKEPSPRAVSRVRAPAETTCEQPPCIAVALDASLRSRRTRSKDSSCGGPGPERLSPDRVTPLGPRSLPASRPDCSEVNGIKLDGAGFCAAEVFACISTPRNSPFVRFSILPGPGHQLRLATGSLDSSTRLPRKRWQTHGLPLVA